MKGNFAIKRTQGRFNRISPDQANEKTISKDQQGPGTTSITLILVSKVFFPAISRLSTISTKVYVGESEHLILQMGQLNMTLYLNIK